MREKLRNLSPEAFTLFSALVGIALAAALALTRVLAFGSFRMMVAVFLVTDLAVYVMMKVGIIKSPRDWRAST